tara:strand:- start:721 stop:906 length:186 start_codon:yes stop_codon:yes gene_type:complete
MVDDLTFYSILSLCYFVGGLTLGYYFSQWKNNRKPKRSGMGRWDYRHGKYPGGEGDNPYFK